MKLYFLLAVILSGLFATYLQAQIKQDLYKEIPKDPEIDDFHMAPFGEYGVLFFGTTGKTEENFKHWNFTFFDASFNEIAHATLNMGETLLYSNCFRDGKNLYLFFNRGSYRGAFGLVTVNAETKEFTFKLHTLPSEKYYLTSGDGYSGFHKDKWGVFQNKLYLKGSTEKEGLLCYDLSTMTRTTFPILHSLEHINFNQKDEEVTVLEINHAYDFDKVKTPAEIILHTFSKGVPVSQSSFPLKEGYNVSDAKNFSIDKNHTVIIGLYNLLGKYTPSGIFFCSVLNKKAEFIYYNFSDFNNFYKCMPEKKQEETLKKNQKAKEKGEEPVFPEPMRMFGVIPNGENQFIAVAQSYSTDVGFQSGYKGMNFSETYVKSVIDGYIHTHAAIVAFEINGKKLWDNCLEMGDKQTLKQKESVAARIYGDTVELLYAEDLYFRSKSIAGSSVLAGKDTVQIKTAIPAKELKYSFMDYVEPWYDNYFIALGRRFKKHHVKDEKIYFFNRVEF